MIDKTASRDALNEMINRFRETAARFETADEVARAAGWPPETDAILNRLGRRMRRQQRVVWRLYEARRRAALPED